MSELELLPLNDEYNLFRKNLEALKDTDRKSREKINSLEEELALMRRVSVQGEQRSKELADKINDFKKKKSIMSKNLVGLEGKNKAQKKTINDLEKKNATLVKESKSMKNKHVTEISRLHQQVETLSTKLQATQDEVNKTREINEKLFAEYYHIVLSIEKRGKQGNFEHSTDQSDECRNLLCDMRELLTKLNNFLLKTSHSCYHYVDAKMISENQIPYDAGYGRSMENKQQELEREEARLSEIVRYLQNLD